MNIEDRRECIVKVFSRYLYGHLLPSSFHSSNGGWIEWANLIRRFADSLEHPKHKQHYDARNEIERLQCEMVDFATKLHTSRLFPVVPYFKEKLYHQIKSLFEEIYWTMSQKLIMFLLQNNFEKITATKCSTNETPESSQDLNITTTESEYLFKTYEILQGNG